MKPSLKIALLFAALVGSGAMLSGCINDIQANKVSIGEPDDFGRAVHEDLAAQISDPDPTWKNIPQPPSNGPKAALAQKAYENDTVKEPQGLNTQGSVTGGAGGGSGGGGGGAP